MKNRFTHNDDKTTTIYYTNSFGETFKTIIDTEDFEKANSIRGFWFIGRNNDKSKLRVKGKINGKNVYLYRFILGISDTDLVVDHIDGDTLNNTKNNLRVVTQKANIHNRKDGFGTLPRNVTYNPRDNKYRVSFYVNGKRKSFGQYFTIEEAEKVAIKAREKYMPDCLS